MAILECKRAKNSYALIFCFITWFSISVKRVFLSQNYVVSIDLYGHLNRSDLENVHGRRIIPLSINNHSLVCLDALHNITSWNSNKLLAAYHQSVKHLPESESRDFKIFLNSLTAEKKMTMHLIAAKLMTFEDQCEFYLRLVGDTYIHLCHRHHITIAQAPLTYFKDIATHRAYCNVYRDELYVNGTIVQYYEGEEKLKEVKLQMDCNLNYGSGLKKVNQIKPGYYIVYYDGPQFCPWNTKTTVHKISKLLYPLERWCQNFTSSSGWHYEYCHPDSAYQFSLGSNFGREGSVPDEIHLVGHHALSNISKYFSMFNTNSFGLLPSATFPVLRSNFVKALETNYTYEWNSLPYVLSYDPQPSKYLNLLNTYSVLNKPLATLILPMQRGSFCERIKGVNIYRRTRVIFLCAADTTEFSHINKPTIQHVEEVALCEYEFIITVPNLCAHPLFLPRLKTNEDTVICYGAKTPLIDQFKSNQDPIQQEISRNIIKQQLLNDLFPTDDDLFNTSEEEQAAAYSSVKIIGGRPLSEWPEFVLVEASEEDSIDKIKILNETEFAMLPFGEGTSVRRRPQNYPHPQFMIGDLVRHSILDITGVIIGWDYSIRASSEWKSLLQQVYSKEAIVNMPFYRIFVWNFNGEDLSAQIPSSILYSPEVMLGNVNIDEDYHVQSFSRFIKAHLSSIYVHDHNEP